MPGIEKKSLTHVKKDSMVWVQEEDGSWNEARFVRIGKSANTEKVPRWKTVADFLTQGE